MIIDSHAHLYPNTDAYADWDFATKEEAFCFHQRVCYTFNFSATRSDTNTVDSNAWELLWDKNLESEWDGMKDVGFRIEDNNYIWEKDGVKYTSPGRREDSPEKFLALMDACGVDAAVLHATMRYSKFNSRMAKKYPGRFLPLAMVEEMDYATPKGIEQLHWAVEELGVKGIYHNPFPAWDSFQNFESDKYKPFWREVAKLGIPVWCISSALIDHYPDILKKIRKWVYETPEVTKVMVHGFPPKIFLEDGEKGAVKIPKIVKEIVGQEGFHMEFLPQAMGYYTHPRSDDMVHALYDEFGGAKFCWGSEFIKGALPHTKEHYSEMMGYFETVCTYMSKSDIELILGENLRRILRLP